MISSPFSSVSREPLACSTLSPSGCGVVCVSLPQQFFVHGRLIWRDTSSINTQLGFPAPGVLREAARGSALQNEHSAPWNARRFGRCGGWVLHRLGQWCGWLGQNETMPAVEAARNGDVLG